MKNFDRNQVNSSTLTPGSPVAVGSMKLVFPATIPELDIIKTAGEVVPEGTPQPVSISLVTGSDPNQTIKVQARDFDGVVLNE